MMIVPIHAIVDNPQVETYLTGNATNFGGEKRNKVRAIASSIGSTRNLRISDECTIVHYFILYTHWACIRVML